MADQNLNIKINVDAKTADLSKTNTELKQLQQNVNTSSSGMKNLKNSGDSAGSSMSALGGQFAIVAAAAIGAALAIGKATKELLDLAEAGANFQNLSDNFTDLSGGTQQATQNLELLRKAASGNLNDQELVTYGNQMLALGYSVQDTALLLHLAEQSTDKFGGQIQDKIGILQRFIETGSGGKAMLSNFGFAATDVESRMRQLSGASDEQIKKMSQQEQETLRLKAVYDLTSVSVEGLNQKQMDTGDKIQFLYTQFDNLKISIGGVLAEAFIPFYEYGMKIWELIKEVINILVGGKDGMTKFKDSIIDLITNGLEWLYNVYKYDIIPAYKELAIEIRRVIDENPELIAGLKVVVSLFARMAVFNFTNLLNTITTILNFLNTIKYLTPPYWFLKLFGLLGSEQAPREEFKPNTYPSMKETGNVIGVKVDNKKTTPTTTTTPPGGSRGGQIKQEKEEKIDYNKELQKELDLENDIIKLYETKIKLAGDNTDEQIKLYELIKDQYEIQLKDVETSQQLKDISLEQYDTKLKSGDLDEIQRDAILKYYDIKVKIFDVDKKILDINQKVQDEVNKQKTQSLDILKIQSDYVNQWETSKAKLGEFFSQPELLSIIRQLNDAYKLIEQASEETGRIFIDEPADMYQRIIDKLGVKAEDLADAYITLGEQRWSINDLIQQYFEEGKSLTEIETLMDENFNLYYENWLELWTQLRAYGVDVLDMTDEAAIQMADKYMEGFKDPSLLQSAVDYIQGSISLSTDELKKQLVEKIKSGLTEAFYSSLSTLISNFTSLSNILGIGAKTFIGQLLSGLQRAIDFVNILISIMKSIDTIKGIFGMFSKVTGVFGGAAEAIGGLAGGAAGGMLSLPGGGVVTPSIMSMKPVINVQVQSEVETTKAITFFSNNWNAFQNYQRQTQF